MATLFDSPDSTRKPPPPPAPLEASGDGCCCICCNGRYRPWHIASIVRPTSRSCQYPRWDTQPARAFPGRTEQLGARHDAKQRSRTAGITAIGRNSLCYADATSVHSIVIGFCVACRVRTNAPFKAFARGGRVGAVDHSGRFRIQSPGACCSRPQQAAQKDAAHGCGLTIFNIYRSRGMVFVQSSTSYQSRPMGTAASHEDVHGGGRVWPRGLPARTFVHHHRTLVRPAVISAALLLFSSDDLELRGPR